MLNWRHVCLLYQMVSKCCKRHASSADRQTDRQMRPIPKSSLLHSETLIIPREPLSTQYRQVTILSCCYLMHMHNTLYTSHTNWMGQHCIFYMQCSSWYYPSGETGEWYYRILQLNSDIIRLWHLAVKPVMHWQIICSLLILRSLMWKAINLLVILLMGVAIHYKSIVLIERWLHHTYVCRYRYSVLCLIV